MKTVNYQLKRKLNEIFIVEPNDLGMRFLTLGYKFLVRYLKTAPFLIIVPFSFLLGYLLYLFFGFLIVRLVTLLQYGF
ncbi:MAG: hypothetical protein ACPL1D_00075 [Microgenomates group bacterium]